MQVGDVILAGHNAFVVTGIYLGDVVSQDLVGLRSLCAAPGFANGEHVKEMLVPEELVRTATIYRRVE